MKHLVLALLFPMTLPAQTMQQLTEQLGKTVLYGDIALSPNGKQVAFLYIEGAGGGGPLMAAPTTTGVIDTAIHNQRIAVLDVASGQLRQISPPDLHIYDYDWSPDDKTFVATAAPGPGDNNW